MRARNVVLLAVLVAGACTEAPAPAPAAAPAPELVQAPRYWNDRELADWATPVVGLNVRPAHFSEQEFYAAPPGEWVRSYPVYFPGREPAGYWEMIQAKKPEPLIAPGPRSSADWIADGKRVFEELDVPAFRTTDPKLFAAVRSVEEFTKMGGHAQKDGRVLALRYVPTSKGLALSITDCATCHTRVMPDGSLQNGAPFNDPGDGVLGALVGVGNDVFFAGDSLQTVNWRSYAVPWIPNDIHERLKKLSVDESNELLFSVPPGAFARFNGSPYYPTKAPDLINIKDRKYIDHTATHQLRGPGDVMRYMGLVSCCDSAEFGPHQLLTKTQRMVPYQVPDHVAYALVQYLYAIEPPANPHLNDPRAAAGRHVFERERCAQCHTPPLYTNNKLTPATGFTPAADHPLAADIMSISVGTDPNLAMKTRKGTGVYKIPSLKGVWYRGLYNHDGSVASLEEWFDPARLKNDFVPSGFKGYKVKNRAVPGHTFGLSLSSEDKASLIAFLRTL